MPTRPSILAALLVAACGLSACGPKKADSSPAPSPIVTPATKLVIHPLTRVGADADSSPVLALHFNFKDETRASVRPLGQLRVEIYKPKAATDTAPQPLDKSWTVDLSDPGRNAASFDDMITRTYSVNLGGVPDWLLKWSKGEGAGSPTLIAIFTPTPTADQPAPAPLRAAISLTR